MDQYNIGPKIGIDGEKEFRAQITRINSEYRSMDSYLKALDKSMAQNGRSQELLASKSNALQQQIAQQQQKYKLLADALAKVQTKTGANSQETLRYKGALLDVENTLSSLQAALAETTQEMTALANGVQHIETSAERAERNLGEYRQQMARLNDEYDAATTYTHAVSRGMDATGASMEGLSNKATGLYRQLDLQQQRFENLHNSLQAATELYGENSAEVLRFEAALEDVKASTAALQRELSATENDLDRMARGLDDVGDAAEVADDKVLSFGDMLKAGIASDAILNGLERAGEMIVDIGKQAIDAASDVKAASAQFQQTFGELEGRATSALKSISDETGMAVTRLQGGYTALYAFTKSVGGDQETALNIAQRALSAAADSAAYYDRTMEDATETLQSFLKGNYANDAALGIAATETTRNAKANELYAKSFKDLTEAQKVDTLLAMVEAGNAASGALGQAAREADAWTNVTGELSEAWKQFLAQLGGPILTGLTPMIQGITEALKGMTEVKSFEKLAGEVEGFTGGMAAAAAELERSNTSMAATAGLAEQYVKRLEAIEAAGLTTADAQREYAQTVELLNALMPELDLSIDQVTGRLNTNTGAITANIASLRRQAQEQAKQAYYNRIIDESSKAYGALADAQIREAELLARKEQLMENGARLYDNLSYAQVGSTQAMASFNASLSAEDKELAAVAYELTVLGGEIRNTEEVIAGLESDFETASKALEDYGDASDAAAESAQLQAEAQAELRKAYEAAKTAARESIDSQIGLFDELADKNEWSAKKIIENWEKQETAFANYEDNLKKAVELGLDEALVKQLSDGSQQSMMILDSLVNDVEISVDEINSGFLGLNESKDSVSEVMGQIRGDFEGTLADMTKKSRSMGKDSGLGVAQGIKDAIPDVEAAMRRLANKGISAYAYEMDQHSPSRVMRAKGKDSGRGAALGVEDSIPDMERAMTALAAAGQESYAQQQLDYVAQYPSMMQGVPGYGGGTTTNTRNVAYGGISININTQPGQDVHSIADVVLAELTVRLGQEEASW